MIPARGSQIQRRECVGKRGINVNYVMQLASVGGGKFLPIRGLRGFVCVVLDWVFGWCLDTEAALTGSQENLKLSMKNKIKRDEWLSVPCAVWSFGQQF